MSLCAFVAGFAPATAQNACSPGDPCVFALANSYRCGEDNVDYYNNRLLQSHFDNGTPNDFSDDPIIFAISNGMRLFGTPEDPNDPLSLPDMSILLETLDLAKLHNKPFLFRVQPWGCQWNCDATQVAAVRYLMCGDSTPCNRNNPQNFVSENWMQEPDGTYDLTFYWCNSNYTITYGLHPDSGLPGPTGLQALIDRNLRHIASSIKTNILDKPENRKYFLGMVIANETHFGREFDHSPTMRDGFRSYLRQVLKCTSDADCLSKYNETYGTSYLAFHEIDPPSPCYGVHNGICRDWNDYRNIVLQGYLGRIANVFEQEGVPEQYLFGHDLVNAGGFVHGPVELPNRNPGLTSYGLGARNVYHRYANCSMPGDPQCRDWAIVEGFLQPNSCIDDNNIDCFGTDLEHLFGIDMRFIQVQENSSGTKFLGSSSEKGLHRWGMAYSDRYTNPQAEIDFDPVTSIVSGCVWDLDSVWRGTDLGSIDGNNVPLEIRIDGQSPISLTADVANRSPWCGSTGQNFSHTLTASQQCFELFAQDYPSDSWIKVFDLCDDEPPKQYVDSPGHNTVASGTAFKVSGWATDASGVTSLVFQVDNTTVLLSNLNARVKRTGPCDLHSDLDDPNCPYVGYLGYLDTTNFANGAHTLKVIATDAVGNQSTFNRSFSVQNVTESDPPKQYVDSPGHNTVASGTAFKVSGWATDASGVTSLVFQVDNTTVLPSNLNTRVKRTGPCDLYSDLDDPNCPFVGYLGYLDTTMFANGAHTLKVIATDAVGNQSTFNRSFSVQN